MKRHFLKFISTFLLLLSVLAATASGSDCNDALLPLNSPPNLAQAFQWLVLGPIARKAAREHLDTKNLGDVNQALLNAFLRMEDSYDESFEVYKAFGASPDPNVQSQFNEQTQARVFFPAAILDSFFPQWHNLEPQRKWSNYIALPTSHLLKKVSDQALVEATNVRLPQLSGRTPGPREGFEQLIAKVIMEFNSELAKRPIQEKLPHRALWTNFEKSVEARALSRGGSEDGLEAGGFFQALFGQSSVPPYFAVYNSFIDAVIGLNGDKLHLEISKKYQQQEFEGEQTYFDIGYEGVSSSYADLKITMQHLALKKGAHVVDIGSGYGRPGAVVGLYFPELQLKGFEIVPERVEIANRFARANGFTNISFETTNLVENPEKIPAADVYFFYEPAKAYTLEKILDAIHKISQSREAPVRLVVRGATGVILPLLTEQNWLIESDRIYANGKFLYYVFSSRTDVTTPRPTYFDSVSVSKLTAIDDQSMERWIQVLLAQPPPVVAKTMSPPIYKYIIQRLELSPGFNHPRFKMIEELVAKVPPPDDVRSQIALALANRGFTAQIVKIVGENGIVPYSVYGRALEDLEKDAAVVDSFLALPASEDPVVRGRLQRRIDTLHFPDDPANWVRGWDSAIALCQKWRLDCAGIEKRGFAALLKQESLNWIVAHTPPPGDRALRREIWASFTQQPAQELESLLPKLSQICTKWKVRCTPLIQNLTLGILNDRASRSVYSVDRIPRSRSIAFRAEVLAALKQWRTELQYEFQIRKLDDEISKWLPFPVGR